MSVSNSFPFDAPDEVWAPQMKATDEMCEVAVAICAHRAKDDAERRIKALWLLDYTRATEMQSNECDALLRSMI